MASQLSLSGTRERQKTARAVIAKEVDEAIFTFVKALDDLAAKHKRCVFIFQTFGTACLMY